MQTGGALRVSCPDRVERWDAAELRVQGPSEGNPFTEQEISAVFTCANETVRVKGFYDGEGSYAVRFMPSFAETYTWKLSLSFSQEQPEGCFAVTPASEGNHGPVRTSGCHFVYEDGKPYYSVGTTCYVWELRDDALIEQTLNSLREAGFNKLRFCVFPKHYDYNLGEPRSYPYEGTPMDSSVLTKENFNEYNGAAQGNSWRLDRFNPAHFQHIERCILRLRDMGVEADIIVMHPYDRWGFSRMTPAQDDLYWRYVIARFAAYRNVWWSLANEYDLMAGKTVADWERYAAILCAEDPYRHLRSVHNCGPLYDFSRPWVTHCSIQRQDFGRGPERTDEWREAYGKPVVLDEMSYEGNIQHGWGNITGEEMVRRFWEAAVRGGYPGHGETCMSPDDVLWWSHGGTLHGESWKRVRFLRGILEETPGLGLRPTKLCWDAQCAVPEDRQEAARTGYRLYYFSFRQPSFRVLQLEPDTDYEVEVIDTWNMTVEKRGVFRGTFRVELPGRPYMAIRIRKA